MQSLEKVVLGISLKNQFLSRNLSQSNPNDFVFSNYCNFFPFQSENRFRAQRPIFNSADHQKWHKLLCSYFCKLVFEELFWLAYLV